MSTARLGMQRSLSFIPRSVSRKSNQENAKTSTTKQSEIAQDKITSNEVKGSAPTLEQKCQGQQISEVENKVVEEGMKKCPDKETVNPRSPLDYDKEKEPLPAKENLPSFNALNADIGKEPPAFSFTKFVESVCKHNNIDIASKENQPDSQVPSTSDNIPAASTDKNSGFSFQSFAEAVYSQQNLPLIDVGALSPRRKVALFTRHYPPLYVPQKPIFDAAVLKENVTVQKQAFSVMSSKQVPGFKYGLVEPASKRFKEAPGTRREELPFGHPRDWELTQCGRQYVRKPKSQQGFDFTVMSYNILAQQLLSDNQYLYTDCDEHVLKWKYRKKQLIAELRHHRPDIICLQEVQKAHYDDFFKPLLHKMGYDSAYIKRSGNKPDGCATFVNQSKFLIEQTIPVEYYRTASGGILDRDNVALILKLRPLSEHVPSDRRLCVTNTHLLFNPRRGDVKLAQIMVLLAELDKCGFHRGSQGDLQYHPVILCGDFNSEPHSELYKLLTMGWLEYEGLLCRVISGQQEGLYRGNNSALGRHFMPTDIGIADTCQYLNVLKSRDNSASHDTGSEAEEGEIVEVTGSQGTGVLSHKFNLVSAYKHTIGRLRHKHSEITTYHNRAACTVDYIFYGVRCKDVRYWNGEVEMRNIEEGTLHLLGRYGLLADHELQEMGGLPNENLSSDHLSLLTSFLLK